MQIENFVRLNIFREVFYMRKLKKLLLAVTAIVLSLSMTIQAMAYDNSEYDNYSYDSEEDIKEYNEQNIDTQESQEGDDYSQQDEENSEEVKNEEQGVTGDEDNSEEGEAEEKVEELDSELSFDFSDFSQQPFLGAVGGSLSDTNSTRKSIASIAYSRVGMTDWKTYVGKDTYDPWCVYFANWCVHQVVNDSSVWPNTGSTNALIKWFQNNNRWHNRTSRTWSYNTTYGYSVSNGTDDGYIPQPADFAAIENDGSSSEPDHTGLVYNVDDNYIYTIEGNIGGAVVYRKYGKSNLRLNANNSSSSYIVGFGEPNLGTSSSYTPVTPVNKKPVGNVDSCVGEIGEVTVTGWAYDPNDTSTSVDIHVYIGGLAEDSNSEPHNMGRAAIYRNDVNQAYRISGDHGFSYRIPTSKRGTQTVCIYAIDTNGGQNTLLAKRSVTIIDEPKMNFDKNAVSIECDESEIINCCFSGSNLYRAVIGSDNSDIATIELMNMDWQSTNASLKVIGKNPGKTNIYMQFLDESGNQVMKKDITVEVKDSDPATIKFDCSDIDIFVGDSKKVKIEWTGRDIATLDAYPENSSTASAKWGNSDANSRYAYINVVGLKAGNTTLIAKLYDSKGNVKVQKKLDISVKEKQVVEEASIKYDRTDISMTVDSVSQVKIEWTGSEVATLDSYPLDDSIVEAKWGSYDTSKRYAYLNITGLKAGTTKLITKIYDAKGKVICQKDLNITVKDKEIFYWIKPSIIQSSLYTGDAQRVTVSFVTDNVFDIRVTSTKVNNAGVGWISKDIKQGTGEIEIKGLNEGVSVVKFELINNQGKIVASKQIDVKIAKKQIYYNVITNSTEYQVTKKETITVPFEFTTEGVANVTCATDNGNIDYDLTDKDLKVGKGYINITGLKEGESWMSICLHSDDGSIAFEKHIKFNVVKANDDFYLNVNSSNYEVNEGESIDIIVNHSTKNVSRLEVKSYNPSGCSVDWIKNNLFEDEAMFRATGLRPGNSTVTISLYDEDNELVESCTICVTVMLKTDINDNDSTGNDNNEDKDTKEDTNEDNKKDAPVIKEDIYYITYVLGGSNVVDPHNMTEYTPSKINRPIRLLSPTRYGYTFDGWYNAETGRKVYQITKDTKGNLKLIAKWKENKKYNNKIVNNKLSKNFFKYYFSFVINWNRMFWR